MVGRRLQTLTWLLACRDGIAATKGLRACLSHLHLGWEDNLNFDSYGDLLMPKISVNCPFQLMAIKV